MAIDFPDSPTNNQIYTSGGRSWIWNGSSWVAYTTTITADLIANGSITSAMIANGTITGTDIAANTISQDKLASNLSAVTITTSSSRSTDVPSPFTGQLVLETDTLKMKVWNGSSWITITVAPPDAPTSLSAVASSTSVAISFTAGSDNGSAITNYEYAVSTNGGSSYGSYTALSPADATSPITVSGLSQGTAYVIKIRAVNGVGSGTESSGVSFTTLTTPNAPTSLSTTSTTTTDATISFTAPSSDGGAAITNYEYSINGGSTWTALSPADASSPVTITGLTMGTTYTVYLRAVNSVGSGTSSAGVSATTLLSFSNVEYLVIAGGGGYRNTSGDGGGGAGGYRSSVVGETSGGGASAESRLTISGGTTYTVTVGAGGSGSNGSNSVFGSITSTGGGRGGNASGGYDCGEGGQNGGSGGGGAMFCAGGGAGTANQGYSGGSGSGVYGQYGAGGGGGGAGGAGSGKNGGAGRASSITGSSVTRAAGGGGEGVNEADGNTPVTGANTGSGGGATNNGSSSGVVIFRYSNTLPNISSIGAGLTYSLTNTGGYKIYTFTAGTGSITF